MESPALGPEVALTDLMVRETLLVRRHEHDCNYRTRVLKPFLKFHEQILSSDMRKHTLINTWIKNIFLITLSQQRFLKFLQTKRPSPDLP